MKTYRNAYWSILLILFVVLGLAGPVPSAEAITYYLRADTTTITMPDGAVIPMWGFAEENAFGETNGVVQVPGPVLEVPLGDNTLTVHIDNNLPEPVSLIIHGQPTAMNPVYFTDGEGRQRMRSFTRETPPGNAAAVTYTWNHVRPGTCLYQSGSHIAVAGQMGLYGCMKKDAGNGMAYVGVPYDSEVILVCSEVDPALHEAVSTGNYGPGMDVTSTMEYQPKYFLINGESYTDAQAPIPAGNAGTNILVRMLNAGLETHVAVFNDLFGTVVAEDGYALAYSKEQYSFYLPASKTNDVIISPETEGIYPVYDRRMRFMNVNGSTTGMLVKLHVEESAELLGDYNNDGVVNIADFQIFQTYYVVGNPLADLNGDGMVTFADWNIMVNLVF